MIEIIPDLWISNDNDVLTSNQTLFNINCTKDLEFFGKSQQYNNEIRENLEKYELIKLYKYLHDTVIIIYNNIKKHNKVVVHCKTGNETSIVVILAFLVKFGKLNLQNAVNIIKTKNQKSIKLNNNYIYVLDKFSKDILLNEQKFNI